jgi:hypothetical protein
MVRIQVATRSLRTQIQFMVRTQVATRPLRTQIDYCRIRGEQTYWFFQTNLIKILYADIYDTRYLKKHRVHFGV